MKLNFQKDQMWRLQGIQGFPLVPLFIFGFVLKLISIRLMSLRDATIRRRCRKVPI